MRGLFFILLIPFFYGGFLRCGFFGSFFGSFFFLFFRRGYRAALSGSRFFCGFNLFRRFNFFYGFNFFCFLFFFLFFRRGYRAALSGSGLINRAFIEFDVGLVVVRTGFENESIFRVVDGGDEAAYSADGFNSVADFELTDHILRLFLFFLV